MLSASLCRICAIKKVSLCRKKLTYYVGEDIWGSKPMAVMVFKQFVRPQAKKKKKKHVKMSYWYGKVPELR
jgi:hypothetical protein